MANRWKPVRLYTITLLIILFGYHYMPLYSLIQRTTIITHITELTIAINPRLMIKNQSIKYSSLIINYTYSFIPALNSLFRSLSSLNFIVSLPKSYGFILPYFPSPYITVTVALDTTVSLACKLVICHLIYRLSR